MAVGILLALIAALLLGVAWVANTLSSVLIPLAIAGIVAYLLDPLVDWFHKKRGMQRQSAIILVFTIALLLVGGLVASIVPALIGQATKLTTEFPKKAKVFQQKSQQPGESGYFKLFHQCPPTRSGLRPRRSGQKAWA